MKDLKSRDCPLGQTTSIRFFLMFFFLNWFYFIDQVLLQAIGYSNNEPLLVNRGEMHNISYQRVLRCLTKMPFDPLNHLNWNYSTLSIIGRVMSKIYSENVENERCTIPIHFHKIIWAIMLWIGSALSTTFRYEHVCEKQMVQSA